MLEHATWFLFAWVYCNQAGVRVPVVPALLGVGVLAKGGHLSMVAVMAIAVGASLAADLTWYGLGRWRGERGRCGGSRDRGLAEGLVHHVGAGGSHRAELVPIVRPRAQSSGQLGEARSASFCDRLTHVA